MSDRTLQRLIRLPPPGEAEPGAGLRVALIVPPSPFVVPCGWEWVHTAPFEGPSIVAAVIRGLGHRLTLLDQRSDPDPEALRGQLTDYDLVAITSYEDSFPYQQRVAALAREAAPHRPVLLGASLVTSLPGVVMANLDADYAVLGEGELTLIELLDHLTGASGALPLEQIKGLAWKDEEGGVRINPARPQLSDLDPVPLQDLSVWQRFAGREIPEVYLSASRGCRFGCSFCYRTMPRPAAKSVPRVRRELQYMARATGGFRHAWWNDLCFNDDHAYTRELMDHALDTHTFSWNAFSRVTDVEPGLLRRMKERGCDILLFGFEAVSQEILDFYRKGISAGDTLRAMETTSAAGIKVGGLFIIGAPGDTPASLERIIRFSQEFKDVTRVKYLSALPGTPLYRQMVCEGIISDEVAHLEFLAREQSVEEDIELEGFLHMARGVTLEQLRDAYRQINGVIQRRPYEYEEEDDRYLDAPRQFKRRPIGSS